MAPRPFWKGYLKLSLVTCPVAMSPALSESARVRFRTVNRRTGNPVVSRYVDSGSGKPVEDDDIVKGYEIGEDKYVMLEDDEIDAVALESTHTIDIDTFVEAGSIPDLYLDRPHFLIPDDEVGEEAFAVIRAAMEKAGVVGISRLVLYRRERAVMLEPLDRGIVVWTLRYGDEVRDPADYFPHGKKADKVAVNHMKKLLQAEKGSWSKEFGEDEVEDNLKDLIAEGKKKHKAKGAKTARKAEPEKPSADRKVVSIMDALKKSLEKGKASR